MSVIINEFEIVPEPASTSASTPSPQPAGEAERTPPAPEIERIMRRLWERELRLWAH